MWDGSTECTILLIKLISKMVNLVFETFDIPQFYLVFKIVSHFLVQEEQWFLFLIKEKNQLYSSNSPKIFTSTYNS
jgi:hypothetical protein